MSFNQSRSDKSSGGGGDSQYRRSGNRFGNAAAASSYQRSNSGRGKPSVGEGPHGSYQGTNNNSFKKSNNVQGGQSRGSVSSANPELNNVQNGGSQQVPSRGVSDVPVSTNSTGNNPVPSVSNINPAGLKSSQSTSVSSNPKPTQTPPKTEGGPPKGFALQFGSISPGFVNAIQIPPRTTSAPPNLDEQNQAQHEFSRTAPAHAPSPAVPLPSIPKHQMPVKEPTVVKHPIAALKIMEKDSQMSSPTSSSPQKPFVTPHSSMSTQVTTFHPYSSHVPVQFGVRPQFQPQMVPSASHQMPPVLSKGNSPLLQQPMFVPSIQPHPMQHHVIMHQGQGLSFQNQLGPLMPHHMGNTGINMGPQFTPPQTVQYGSPRRAVKITHPDTLEELKLDRRRETVAVVSPKAGIQSNVPPRTQPILPVITPHSSNYYASSFTSSVFHPPVMSVPLTPELRTSRGQYPISQSPQSTTSANPSAGNKVANSLHSQAESLDKESTGNITIGLPSMKQNVSITVSVSNEVSQIGTSNAKLLHGVNVTSSSPTTMASQNFTEVDTPVLVKSPTSGNTQSTPAFEVPTSGEGFKKGSVTRSSSIKDQQKKPNHIEQHQSQPQGCEQVIAPPTTTSSDDRPARITEGIASVSLSGPTKVVSIATSEDRVSPDASGSPKLNFSINTTCEGSGGQVESLHNKELEQVSGQLNDGTKEDVASKENSSLTTAAEALEAQNIVMDSVNVRSPRAYDVDLEKSIIPTEKYELTIDDSRPPTTALESKGHESLKEATVNHVDGINSNIPGSDDRAPLDLIRPKSAAAKGKKNLKEILQKADAEGTSSDLYTAYKATSHKDSASSTVATESEFTGNNMKQLPVDTKEDSVASNNQTQGKSEPDNWEDADDDTSPKLKIASKSESGSVGSIHDAIEMKKYTKDFLMKFKDQCDTLPKSFNIPQELLRALLSSNVRSVKVDRSASDRSIGTARSERREIDDNKWSKGSGSSSSRDLRPDFGHGNNMGRPGSGGNSGGRHPRGQAGGILPGPLQSMNSFHRETVDGDRWHRHPNSQRGLMSSPHTPAQVMHKAEKKYEVGKVTDEEQAKQRQLKGILNKLTPQNFERLFEQVKAVHIDTADTLTGVISQIFDKALMEPTFCEMYADFCQHLSGELPDFTEGDEKITFKRVLLNKCQEEFVRGESEEEEANKVEEEGDVAQSNEEREEKRVMARRRMLGNIRLIGELYKKRMLTERIMHECIKKLLGSQHNAADEEDIEALCKLMSTIGEMIDHPKAKNHMDAYFDMMLGLSNNMKYSSRVRFMLKDSIDLRRNKWQQRRKVEGPKKIEDVHRDAVHERQAQAQSSRLTRAPSMNAPNRRGTSTDFGPRGSSILPSPNSHHGEYRSFPSQAHRFGGTQDIRLEERQPLYEGRNASVLLPQRGAGSDTVTLGPQGGLARGMSTRGAPPAQTTPTSGLSGYRSSNERSGYDNAIPRSASGRLVPAYSQPSGLERNLSLENEMRNPVTGRTADRDMTVDTAQPAQTLSEEGLRSMSTSTIKEFYSAKDEKEVALCIKDMNTPSFHPSMVALWVSDSFERKDMERNLLSKLLVSLAKSQDNTLTHNDLLKGFELVLSTLDDAVNDAPKAPEFLGRIFATVIVENVIPMEDIREIVHKGGEEPGSLVESGLAGDVIGNILEVIQSDKDDSYLKEIRSSLRLEDFRPRHPLKSKTLEKFL